MTEVDTDFGYSKGKENSDDDSPPAQSQEQEGSRTLSYNKIEERDKRKMEWVLSNTGDLLGEESEELGKMSERSVLLTLDLMRVWSKRAIKRESKAAHVVERLLQKLLKEKDAGNERLKINTAVYNIVLESWANSREEGSAERSEEILMEMERMYNQGNRDVLPNEASYNAVIKAYVKNGGRAIAPPKVTALVNRMERSNIVSPTRRSYNLLLYCLAKSNLEDAAPRAEDILHRMLQQYLETDNMTTKPDINSYNQLLGAWARGRNEGYEERMQTIYEEILDLPPDMHITPTVDTFNTAMSGWLKSEQPSALSKIEQILETMETSFKEGNRNARPDRVTINTICAAFAKTQGTGAMGNAMKLRASLEKEYDITPDVVSYNIIVDSWCKSGRKDSPEQAIEILNAMENDFKDGKISHAPDGYTYSSVIGCFANFRRPDAAEKAEELLKRMKDLWHNFGGEPLSASVYNAVINAWASSPSLESSERVKELLNEMDENHATDPSLPAPNRITYNTVIKAMRDGSGDDAAFAEKILYLLESKGAVQSAFLPDSYSYTSVVSAYGRSDAKNKAEKALEIIERMLLATENGNIAANPTVHSFNAALNACAFVKGDEKAKEVAFDIAMKIFELLQVHDAPDHTSYGTVLRACSVLLPSQKERREALVDEFFKEACLKGCVGRLVLTQMQFASSPEQYARLLGHDQIDKITVRDVPRSWTQNVREKVRGSTI
ncbi:unnamed protein product [Cylindrotheca closterium]|uniref:PROP1-like PPR domain-containing protein n=1 Tax=Cylindrotheca closterium TaxID=2856 RepID=A0AAD2CK54_9STRA|nr:unnamed protein product [Cylindrotheca closterium]